MHWDTFKQDDYSTVGGDGGCRVGDFEPFPFLASFVMDWLQHNCVVRGIKNSVFSDCVLFLDFQVFVSMYNLIVSSYCLCC